MSGLYDGNSGLYGGEGLSRGYSGLSGGSPGPVVGPPVNTVAPSIVGAAYVGETVALLRGTWSDATSYEGRLITDEVTPTVLLDWAEVASSVDYSITTDALGVSLIYEVRATGAGGTTTEQSASFGAVDAYVPDNTVAPAIQAALGGYGGENVLLDLGEWSYADTYRVKVDAVDGTPANLLAYTATTGAYAWTIPLSAVGRTLRLTVKATGVDPADVIAEVSTDLGPITAPQVLINNPRESSSASTASATQTIANYVVAQANSRVLLVFAAGAISSTFSYTGATYGGTAMTLVSGTGTAQGPDGTVYANTAVFMMVDPPVGTADIVVTRSETSTTKFHVHAVTLQDCDPATIDVAQYFDMTDTATYTSSGSGAPDATEAYQQVIVHSQATTATTTDTLVKDSSYTAIGNAMHASGSGFQTLLQRKETSGSGTVTCNNTITGGGNSRRILMTAIVFKPVPHQDVPPVYYFDPVSGNDSTGDGLSLATAWKTADKLEPLLPLVAGTEIIVKGGTRLRKTAAETLGTPMLDITCNGTSTDPVIFKSTDGTKFYICGDLPLTGWASASSGETNATAVSLGAEKKTLGAFSVYPQVAPAFGDDVMLQPCYWSAGAGAGVWPTSIHDWNLQVPGTDSYKWVDAADVQDGSALPSAYDSSKEIQCKQTSAGGSNYNWTIRIQHPDIATHYGATSPVGALVVFKTANVQNRWHVITSYDQAGSWIELETYVGALNRAPDNTSDNYWAILCHPFDLRQAGQFARIGNDIFCTWVGTPTTKSVAANSHVLRLRGQYYEIQDPMEVSRCAEDYGDGSTTHSIFEIGGHNNTIDVLYVGESINPNNPPALGCQNSTTPFYDSTISELRTFNCRNHSGWRANFAYNNTLDKAYLNELGRTGAYFGGDNETTQGSNYNTVNEVWMPQHSAVHGNGISAYQYSNNITINGAFITDSPIALTSQGGTSLTNPKNCSYSKFFAAGQREIGITATARPWNTPLVRMDGGDTDLSFTDFWALSAQDSAISLGNDSSGTALNRIATQTLSFGATGEGAGVTMTSVIAVDSIYGGTGASGSQSWDAWGGATITDDSDVFASDTVYPISENVWEFMTRTGSGGHEAKYIGPISLGWQIPAYGGTITMGSLSLVSTFLRGTWQAGKAVGTIAKVMPKSTLSLPAGVTDNDDFIIDECYLVPVVALPAGTYSVTVRETNASASNGPTHDTVLSVVIT